MSQDNSRIDNPYCTFTDSENKLEMRILMQKAKIRFKTSTVHFISELNILLLIVHFPYDMSLVLLSTDQSLSIPPSEM
jgi:hypothetical protein